MSRIAIVQGRLPHPLRIVRIAPEELDARWGAWVSTEVPSLLVIRGGQVVGGAMGRLSARDLEDVVRRALA